MKKKNNSGLLNMIEKERHRVAASITREQEWEQPEPNSGLARMFVIMLLVHVFVIGGIIIYDFIGDSSSHSAQASSTASPAREQSSTAANISAAPLPMVTSAAAAQHVTETPKAVETPAPDAQQPSPLANMPKALAYTPPAEEKPALSVPETKPESTPILTAKATTTSDPIAFKHQEEESDTKSNVPTTSRAGSSGLEQEKPKTQAEKPKPSSATPAESTRGKAEKPARQASDKPSTSGQPKPVPSPSAMRKALAGDSKPPSATTSSKKTNKDSDPPSPKKAARPSAGSATKHTIVKGDTVYSLAHRFKVSEAALMKANGIKNANALTIGKVVTIPASK